MKKIGIISCLFLGACSHFSSGTGQVIYHWERPKTGIQKFASDHGECLISARSFKLLPDFRSWFYTEETKIEARADWKSDKGVWATYIPYPGAQPLVVNSRYDDTDITPGKYASCMRKRGYQYRKHDIPEITNINVSKPNRSYLMYLLGKTDYPD